MVSVKVEEKNCFQAKNSTKKRNIFTSDVTFKRVTLTLFGQINRDSFFLPCRGCCKCTFIPQFSPSDPSTTKNTRSDMAHGPLRTIKSGEGGSHPGHSHPAPPGQGGLNKTTTPPPPIMCSGSSLPVSCDPWRCPCWTAQAPHTRRTCCCGWTDSPLGRR